MSLPEALVRQLCEFFSVAPLHHHSPLSGLGASALSVPTSPPQGRAPTFVKSPLQGLGTEPSAAPSAELAPDILEQILRHCDADTLIGTVPVVCKAWRKAATSPNLWRHRLSSKLLAELEPLAALGPPLSLARLYLVTQGRNFLRNPGFRSEANTQPPLGRSASKSKWQRNAWVTTTTAMGDGVAWEAPPAGIRTYPIDSPAAGPSLPPPPLPYPGSGTRLTFRLPVQQLQSLFGNGSGGFGNGGCSGRGREEHQQSCLATANDWCEVVQVVDLDWELQRRGLAAAQAAHLLDSELSLRFSVYVGSRWNCVGQYSVGLILDEGNGNANGYGYGSSGGGGGNDDSIPSLQSFVMRPTRHHLYTGRVCCTCDRWERFEYTVPACPRGFRRAVVVLRGRRAPNSLIVSPMPKYCGAKFSSAELVFL